MTATEEEYRNVTSGIFNALACFRPVIHHSCHSFKNREPRESLLDQPNLNLPLIVVSKSDPTKLLMLNGSCSSSPRVGATGDKPR